MTRSKNSLALLTGLVALVAFAPAASAASDDARYRGGAVKPNPRISWNDRGQAMVVSAARRQALVFSPARKLQGTCPPCGG
jgi:ABC-type sugar transport system substrate-binding protein